MNKIVMCLVFISCSSLFSMDSDITVKLLDDDGNVEAERQMPLHVLKSKSNTLKEMFGDIPASEVSIPTSEISVKTWDEIESLWTSFDSKMLDVSSRVEFYDKLTAKKLHELVCILNGLEYLNGPDQASVSSAVILQLVSKLQANWRNAYDPVLEQLKPRLTRLVIDSMFPKPKLYKSWRSEPKEVAEKRIFTRDRPYDFTEITYQPPQNITIPQAMVLLKIVNDHSLEKFKAQDGRFINELKIYNRIDKDARSDIDYYFTPNNCCTIL